MDYFKNLQFIRAANLPDRKSYHPGRTFDNYYSIHYCHAGDFSLKIDNGLEETSSTPCAFLAFPQAEFAYGNPQNTYHHLYVCFRGELAEQWREGGLLCCLSKNALIPILNPRQTIRPGESNYHVYLVQVILRVLRVFHYEK